MKRRTLIQSLLAFFGVSLIGSKPAKAQAGIKAQDILDVVATRKMFERETIVLQDFWYEEDSRVIRVECFSQENKQKVWDVFQRCNSKPFRLCLEYFPDSTAFCVSDDLGLRLMLREVVSGMRQQFDVVFVLRKQLLCYRQPIEMNGIIPNVLIEDGRTLFRKWGTLMGLPVVPQDAFHGGEHEPVDFSASAEALYL